MYKQFTTIARNVMQLANQEAQRCNHPYFGTEHLLLGLVSEGTGVAANILKNLDIDLRKVRIEVESIVLPGPEATMGLSMRPLTPRTKKAIEYAIDEARLLGHDYVGTEHLLLGLVRESEGVAAQVLMNLGLNLKVIRAEVLNLLGRLPDSREVEDFTRSPSEDEDEPASADAPTSDIQHLPESAREIVAEFDCQIDVIKEEKEQVVGDQEWQKAADLRDLEYKLRKLRDDFISHWPKS
jgi:ATP-dependent Clp protease ATP-binding subunit ClpC